jgi:hypothetical protein
LVFLLIALLPAACAKQDPTVASLTGSEPQRLAFGAPSQVLIGFVDKMKLCWFSGAKPVLHGYHYETGHRPPDPGDDQRPASDGYDDIKIYSDSGGPEMFEVEFHQYNENTLIVTRNLSLPDELFDSLKRDIQLWALSGPDCKHP